jgi:hypothetical protein
MNTAQIQELIVQNSKGLPKDVLQEILDFIQFLKIKKTAAPNDSIQSELRGISANEENHLEEEFLDYKTIYPAE